MNGIIINNHHYTKEDIISFSGQKLRVLPAFVRNAFVFLQSWFDENSEIQIKTSGSTGIPKKIQLSKEAMLDSARSTLMYFGLKPGDNVLLPLAADYIAGKMMLVRAIAGGLNLVLLEPHSIVNIPNKECFKLVAMVPMQVEATLKQYGKDAFSGIESLIIGGAPISEHLEHLLADLRCKCFATYGMTETASHVALRRLNHAPFNSQTYYALPGVYFSTDIRNCLVIDAPGRLRHSLTTNDVVQLTNDSSFIWKGRYDFVVNSGGIKLFPEEIERKLTTIIHRPFYLSSELCNHLGEQLILVIEGLPLSVEAENMLFQEMSLALHRYEKPRKIYYVDRFQYTETGKLLRRKH